MNYCTFCGTKLDQSHRYCSNCGAQVSGTISVNPKNSEIENETMGKTNSPEDKLKIDVVGSTILGLITFGIWWALFIKKWSELYLKYYEDKSSNSMDAQSSEILNSVKQSTNRTLQLSTITLVMLSAGLIILFISFLWEVVLDIGGFPLPEGPFWFYCWISLSMLAVTWASILYGIFKVLELKSSGWLPLNGSSGIILTTVIWCVVALGLLPLVIFPPIYSGSVNKYVSSLTD